MKRSAKRTLGLAALNLFFISICLIGLVPILYAFLLSVSSGSGALTTGLSILPEKYTLDNYRTILVEKPFLKWLSNSVVLSVGTMVLAMGTSVTASYAFSRFRFPGRRPPCRYCFCSTPFLRYCPCSPSSGCLSC